MNILIVGSNGQLGSEIRAIANNYTATQLFFYDLPDIDITERETVVSVVKEHSINAIINCSAYTAVDNAEDNQEAAYRVNCYGVEQIVSVAEQFSLKLIHISTDYVFDGTNNTPYSESDPVSPLGVYGQTKYEGEQAVFKSSCDSIVIRTSWLYSAYGNNFVKTMIKLGSDRDSLGVISDQVGTPTSAADLAEASMQIITKSNKISEQGRLYHYSNEGVASWFDFAKAIHSMAKISCKVKAIETKDFPTKATRPNYSVLNKSKIKSDFNIEIPYWRDSLEECIDKLRKLS